MSASASPMHGQAGHLSGSASITGIEAGTPAGLVPRLKTVLRGVPGPVALITTRDPVTGQPAGLAASAVIPVCMAPPSMLVCVNRSASAHAVIEASGRFCINLIGPEQIELVEVFSNTALRQQRFVDSGWSERHGLPHLPAAPASLFCQVRTTLLFGTHEAFIGEVFDIAACGTDKPVGWLDGVFVQCTAMNGSSAKLRRAHT